jgi:hypothetical protein
MVGVVPRRQRSEEMMKGRVVARVALSLLVLTGWLDTGYPGRAVPAFAAEGPAEFILRTADDRIGAVASRHGLTVMRPLDEHLHGVFLVRGPAIPPPDTTTATLVTAVRSDPDVELFETNASAVITETPGGPRLSESTVAILDSLTHPGVAGYFGTTVWDQYVTQPALAVIRLADAQPLASGGGIVVAVVDTGVDPRHSALSAALVPGYDFTRNTPGQASEWPDLDESTVAILDRANTSILTPSAPVSVNESTVAILDQASASELDITRLPAAFGHGTMVAGLIHLVAPTARIMPLKAFRADGTSSLFDVERAIYFAVDHGAKVINMSFSTPAPSAELTQAIAYATSHGVICLASAGNEGRTALVFPAGFRNVIGVGSTTMTGGRSSFSNYGDHLVAMAAPGESLITLYPGGRYASVSGTSFSAALASGGAALLAQLEPAVDQRLASRYLDDGAVKRPDLELGNGRLDLFATLRTHAPLPPPPDTVAPVVALSSPAPGVTIGGIFPLVASASDNVGVTSLVFTLDGAPIGTPGSAATSQLNWDTASVANGVHVLAVTARDAAGNQRTSTSVSVTVMNDTTAPVVTVMIPGGGAAVTGTVTLMIAATDNVGVAGLQLTLDGVTLVADQPNASYVLMWNSATVTNGAHVLAATARDGSGNRGTSTAVVNVTNLPHP